MFVRMDHPSPAHPKTRVLFVCLGNICRSPLAEGVFRHLAEEAGLAHQFDIDSAGTGSWHVGEPPDARASLVASKHGITLESRGRQVTREDFQRFDYVIAMDRDNLRVLERMKAETGSDAVVALLRSFDPEADGDDVPDPYYGGSSGFEQVFQIIRKACRGLLEQLPKQTA